MMEMKTYSYLWFCVVTGINLIARNTVVATSNNALHETSPKNIILFMTDDQDVTANSIHPSIMPRLNRLFREGGMEFSNYYVPTGLCCPSRTTILRGQYCHNTEIYDNGNLNNATYRSGGWKKFLENGLEEETIATLMQSAGYETAMIGKYMNGYDLFDKMAALHKPPGWDHWMGLLKCMAFYGPVFSEDGERVLKTNKTLYQTDFIRDWVLDFLSNRRDPSKPFFLMVTPFAPHTPAIPAERHKHLFSDAKFPRYASFNPSDDIQMQRPAWIKNLPKLTEKQIDDMDNFYRNRLRSLQAVDEALESVVGTLDDLGLTNQTYFIYTADNGQHFGDHRIPAGKRQAFESDVLVPFLVRGPGIPKGSTSSQVVQSVDLGPTFLDLAVSSQSIPIKPLKSTYPMDGKSIMPLLTSHTPATSMYNNFRWAALFEMYGGSSNIGKRYKNVKGYFHDHMYPNTYQAVRVINGPPGIDSEQNLLYVEWCTGEQELYNMTVDPHQIHNLLALTPANTWNSSLENQLLPLVKRLSKLVARLGACKGSECYELKEDLFIHGHDTSSVHGTSLMSENISSPQADARRSLESLQSVIQRRLPCHDPPISYNSSSNENHRRRPFAYQKFVPEPFSHGFPFSDGDLVDEELLEIWETYYGYFY